MDSSTPRILIIGAAGQVGTELTENLQDKFGTDNVVSTDIRWNDKLAAKGPFRILDVMDREGLFELIKEEKISQVYHLAAMLSATGEKFPKKAWDLNMVGLLNVLDAGVELKLDKVFWPSSIAVFGPDTPRDQTPQVTIMNPNTVYGISKLAGERWCEYYADNYGLDVRSLRYPGLIGFKSDPGGGTTDYAVEIFHKALENGKYTSFLKPGTFLPMMYMPDAIRATIELMEAPAENIKTRSSYNLAGISFDPEEIANEIKGHLPNFEMAYDPDFRQDIADSWPSSIDDSAASADWGWNLEYDLPKMVADMLENLKKKISVPLEH